MQLGKLLWGANIYADGPDPSYQLYAIILYEQPNGSTDEMVNKLGGGPVCIILRNSKICGTLKGKLFSFPPLRFIQVP